MSAHRLTAPLSALAASVVLSAAAGNAAAADPMTAAGAIDRALRSVVSVLPVWQSRPARGPGRDPAYGGGQRAPLAPEGSGIAILPGGFVATADHVLRDAKNVRVRLSDGRILSARVVGRHKPTDIALLKVEVKLPAFEITVQPSLATPVCAIGNQFGLGLSVTCGVVSARHRSGTGFNPIEDFVQTDASVNPGGSGGALVDGKGRLVGMVSAIFTKESDANVGINFATSARLIRRVADDLKDHGVVREGTIGLEAGPLSERDPAGLVGVTVVQVERDGAAFAAGAEAGDIITAVDGRPVITPDAFRAALFLKRPGDAIRLRLKRSGKTQNISLRVVPSTAKP